MRTPVSVQPLVRLCLRQHQRDHAMPVAAGPVSVVDKPMASLTTGRSPAVLCLNRTLATPTGAEMGPTAATEVKAPMMYAAPPPTTTMPRRGTAPKPALVAKCVNAGTKFLNYSTWLPSDQLVGRAGRRRRSCNLWGSMMMVWGRHHFRIESMGVYAVCVVERQPAVVGGLAGARH